MTTATLRTHQLANGCFQEVRHGEQPQRVARRGSVKDDALEVRVLWGLEKLDNLHARMGEHAWESMHGIIRCKPSGVSGLGYAWLFFSPWTS